MYTKPGKSYLKPLNTRFIFIGSNSSDVNIFVVYGNTNSSLKLSLAFFYLSLGALAILWI